MKNFAHELTFKTSRSSGAGGQHVNKVETAVTVSWDVASSAVFSAEEKDRILLRLKNRINSDGILAVTASDTRTQNQNKKNAVLRLQELVEQALQIPKPRKATRPSKSKIEKRLQAKKYLSEKKENRRSKW